MTSAIGRAPPREYVAFEKADQTRSVVRRPTGRILHKPFPGNYLEAVGSALSPGRAHRFTIRARVYAGGQQLPRFVSTTARFFQAHFWVDAEREPLLLAVVTVFESPPLPAPRGDLEVQAAPIEVTLSLLLRLGVLNCSISKGHAGGNSGSGWGTCP
jgi:hypothetical protein